MSEQVITMIKNAPLPSLQKLVLTMMAMYADSSSMVCKASVITLCEAAGLTPAHLMHVRRELARLKYIKPVDSGYRVFPGKEL